MLEKVEKNKLLMMIFLFSESFFFIVLILAYASFHRTAGVGFESTGGPTALSSLNPVRTGIFTFILILSSFSIWLGGKSLKAKRHSMLCLWIFVTIALGALFLYGQGTEWLGLIKRDITISRDIFGTTFFTLTGFHGFHVTVGLIMLSVLLGLALAGDFRGPKSAGVESVSLYWHFVDVVWIAVYSVIYLWAFL
jgi:cytochrome c oxidase subunit III